MSLDVKVKQSCWKNYHLQLFIFIPISKCTRFNFKCFTFSLTFISYVFVGVLLLLVLWTSFKKLG